MHGGGHSRGGAKVRAALSSPVVCIFQRLLHSSWKIRSKLLPRNAGLSCFLCTNSGHGVCSKQGKWNSRLHFDWRIDTQYWLGNYGLNGSPGERKASKPIPSIELSAENTTCILPDMAATVGAEVPLNVPSSAPALLVPSYTLSRS